MIRILALALMVSGCLPFQLPLPAGFETLVANRLDTAHVIRVEVQVRTELEERYYASPPGSDVVVDTVGDANFPTPSVVILSESCEQLFELTRDFSEGALITLNEGSPPTVELGRTATSLRHQSDQELGERTCEAAAAQLH